MEMNGGGGCTYVLNFTFLGSGQRKTSAEAEAFSENRTALGSVWEARPSYGGGCHSLCLPLWMFPHMQIYINETCPCTPKWMLLLVASELLTCP